MTGVDIDQYRGNIGTFYRRKMTKKFSINCSDCDSYHTTYLRDVHRFLSKALEFLFNLLLLFSYCSLIVIIFPICILMQASLIFIFNRDTHISSNPLNLSLLQLVQIFLGIQQLPKIIPIITSSIYSFFKKLSQIKKNILFFIFVLGMLLIMSGSIEMNPGPTQTKKSNLSFAVWNLDSLPARDYARIQVFDSFQASYDFDIFGVCESFLNKDVPNGNIFIDGFSADPFRADKPLNIRNGGVCLYFKENLPITERCDLEIIPETIVAEVKLNRTKIFLVLSYCHPNLSNEEHDNYINGLEDIYKCISKENPAITIFTGDFNARSPLFWENDTENIEGRALNNFLMLNNLDELINEPTHIRDDGSQSCIDLIITDQPFIFTDTGVLPSLDPHSKHNIIHGTLNFNSPSPPPYKRKIWAYKSAKTDLIRKDLLNTNWPNLFTSLNVNEMALVFTDVLLNILSKHIDNKIITCKNKDAQWITPAVKSAIRRNSKVYRKWVKRGRKQADHDYVREVQNHTNKMIRGAKQLYYKNLGNKLSDPQTGQKTFWNAFKKCSDK